MGKTFWKTAIFSLLYWAAAVTCLAQWGGANLWSRINIFSGSYLALRALGTLHSLAVSQSAFRSTALGREWWGTTSEPRGVRWVVLLMLADLAVFLDYGHWRLLPELEQPLLQGVGLGLYLFVTVWQMWTDAYLAKYFGTEQAAQAPLEHGPFHFVRHPRYAAAMAGKFALAMVFASVLGWLATLAWAFVLLQQIQAEESHLRKLFGEKYETYAQRRARVLPGIY